MARPQSEGSGKTGSAELARLIRERRHALGMSRQDLAESTGIPYSTLAQIETAYRGVSPSRLGVIARALQLDPKELYDVLASEPTLISAPAPVTTRARSARGDRDAWHANPGSAAARPPAPTAVTPGPAGSVPAAEVVDQVVELLSALPAEERLDALGDVQRRMVSGMVQDELRRTPVRPDGPLRSDGRAE